MAQKHVQTLSFFLFRDCCLGCECIGGKGNLVKFDSGSLSDLFGAVLGAPHGVRKRILDEGGTAIEQVCQRLLNNIITNVIGKREEPPLAVQGARKVLRESF